ncbi:MAG: hypothetical protein C7B43_14300 [Sulfobacillus benefaciens]|uniref:Uncharacterized protein n=1 Tax=Sulfobacillus benefaciens TaxID=453960 RepID=A0A2T2WVK4_9FIRM|nr:MAG: hypothetical protein C7B43_14300 [Sulfobacillus benefaciens]
MGCHSIAKRQDDGPLTIMAVFRHGNLLQFGAGELCQRLYLKWIRTDGAMDDKAVTIFSCDLPRRIRGINISPNTCQQRGKGVQQKRQSDRLDIHDSFHG